MKVCVLIFLLALPYFLAAQSGVISGVAVNTSGKAIQGATITLRPNDSTSVVAYAVSRADGSFSIGAKQALQYFILEARHISYKTQRLVISDSSACCPLRIEMQERTEELREIVIKRELPAVMRSDTVAFNANSYASPEVRKVEDLLKKIQGFSVDPNGRLSFNGKPVERVMIEGEDLAERGYQLVTRNLDANLIDKVEVIDNFNTNRLMRDVERTNKVGINLKISSKYKAKLSGSAELGLSPNERYLADMNGIYIGKKVKWLGFGNYNNIARDPAGNVKYYYQQEGGQGDEAGEDPDKQLLETGSVSAPNVGDRYVKDNSDLGLALMNSLKAGKYTRINVLGGYSDLSLLNRAGSLVVTEISDQDKWTLINVMQARRRSNDLLLRFSIHTDEGKRHVRRINVGYQAAKAKQWFSDLLSGAVTDSLNEQLLNHGDVIRLGWQETFLMKKKVFRINADFTKRRLMQELDNHSARYFSFWHLDSSYLGNRHRLDQQKQLFDLDLKINGTKGPVQYEYGVGMVHRKAEYYSQATATSIGAKPDSVRPPVQMAAFLDEVLGEFKLGSRTGRKGRLSMKGELGYGSLFDGKSNSNFVVVRGAASFIHNFSMFRSLRFSYNLFKGFDEYQNLYPGQMLSGNGTVLNGLLFERPIVSHTWMGSFQAGNIYRQRNWSFSTSYKDLPGSYLLQVAAMPGFTEFGFLRSRENRMFNSVLKWESYFKSLGGRLGASANYFANRSRTVINGAEGHLQRSSAAAEGWWTSGFKFPLNAELRSGFNYGSGRWNRGTWNSNWQYYWSTKLKWKMQSAYAAMSWKAFRLSDRNLFYGVDLYASYIVSKGLHLDLTGVNLLNAGRVVERTVMPFNVSETGFYLVGRYLLLSASIAF